MQFYFYEQKNILLSKRAGIRLDEINITETFERSFRSSRMLAKYKSIDTDLVMQMKIETIS